MRRDIVWERTGPMGLEHLILEAGDTGVRADGVLVMPFNSERHMTERTAPAIDGGRRWPRTERTVRAALGEVDRLHRYVDAGHVVADPVPASVAAAAEVLRADLGAARVA